MAEIVSFFINTEEVNYPLDPKIRVILKRFLKGKKRRFSLNYQKIIKDIEKGLLEIERKKGVNVNERKNRK